MPAPSSAYQPAGDAPRARDIVLVGGGHSHAVALLRFAQQPPPGVRVTLVSSAPTTPYSGMLPGYVAGHYRHDEIHIDLRRLAALTGAHFVCDEATGIDRSARRLLRRGGEPLAYDLLSLDIGATPELAGIRGAADCGIPVKPIAAFDAHWQSLLARARQHAGRFAIAVVGGGAAGVELVLAMAYRLRRERVACGRDADELAFDLYAAGPTILPTHAPAVRATLARTLAARGIRIHHEARIVAAEAGRIVDAAGVSHGCDEVVWVTAAAGASWLRTTGLALDASGFVRIGETLQSESDPAIFAAGDCASFVAAPLAKAGVFAVRMGRPLADNLRRAVLGEPLQPWRPQRLFLSLMATGDRRAVASRGAFFASGAWVWHWKDRIDRGFMRRFTQPLHRRLSEKEAR